MLPSKYFLEYSRKYAWSFWSGMSALLVTSLLDILPPLVLKKGIDQVAGGASHQDILITTLEFTALVTALAVMRYFWRILFGGFHQGVAQDLRRRVFEKLTKLGPRFYNSNPTGELMSLVTNDIEAVRMGMGPGVLVVSDAVIYLIAVPFVMFTLSVPLTLQSLCLMPFLPFFIRKLSDVIHRRFLEVQEKFSNLSGICQENMSGMRIIKSFAQEDNHIRIFNEASESWRQSNLKVAWAEAFFHPVMELAVAGGIVILLYFGSHDIASGTLTVGTFVAFHRYIIKMTWPMTAIGWGVSLISQGRASLDRIDEFLRTPLDVPSPESTDTLDLLGPIQVKNLTFKYPNSENLALKDIDLTMNPGEVVGFTGPVGSGKTTLAQLLCHLYAVPNGVITVNHIDINSIPHEQLRSHVTLVPQDTFLFSTSIQDNISFGTKTPVEMESLKRVAELSKIRDEIEGLPEQYGTYLGERGVNLSGGQKQRIAISRALLRQSPVVIFDDSLSAVDSETESVILRRLNAHRGKQSTIIISHRLSTLSLCDKIVVLKDGQIQAQGAHDTLIKESATYRELIKLQGLS